MRESFTFEALPCGLRLGCVGLRYFPPKQETKRNGAWRGDECWDFTCGEGSVPLYEGGMVIARSIFGLPLCLLPGLFEVNQVIEWTSN